MLDFLHVAAGILLVMPPVPQKVVVADLLVAVCPGPNSQVFPSLPVVEVVARLKLASGIVRNFITLQAFPCKRLFDHLRHGDLFLLWQWADFSGAIFPVKGSPLLKGEVVCREVGRVKAQGLAQVGL